MTEKALIAMNLKDKAYTTGSILGKKYEVVNATEPDNLDRIAEEGDFSVCLMDANFGHPLSTDIDVALKIFSILKRKDCRFMSVGDISLLQLAKSKGLPFRETGKEVSWVYHQLEDDI